MSFASTFLTTPTLRLRVPSASGDEQTYTVHRSILSSKTNLLSHHVPRSTTSVLLPSNTPIDALERLLEFLYTNSYSLPASILTPASSTPHPVVGAAMLGAIGVWGKPAAVHDPVTNLSSYSSSHFPSAYHSAYEPAPMTPPSSPPTEFAAYEPELNRSRSPSTATVAPPPKPEDRLAAHLGVYRLATVLEVQGLTDFVLLQIKNELEASRELLREIVREVYGTKSKSRDQKLTGFVIETVTTAWGSWKGEKVMRELVEEGGEFVVQLVGEVNGF